jgi:hypothetical protein
VNVVVAINGGVNYSNEPAPMDSSRCDRILEVWRASEIGVNDQLIIVIFPNAVDLAAAGGDYRPTTV